MYSTYPKQWDEQLTRQVRVGQTVRQKGGQVWAHQGHGVQQESDRRGNSVHQGSIHQGRGVEQEPARWANSVYSMGQPTRVVV